MAGKPNPEFGKRHPDLAPAVPVKRSGHVALLLMGTFAVGGGAYALMPRETCTPPSPGMAAPQAGADCSQRSYFSGGGHGGSRSSRTSLFSGDTSSDHSSSGTSSDSGTGRVTRGGFGSFARAFAGHFSIGG